MYGERKRNIFIDNYDLICRCGTGKYILVPHFLNANFIMYINHVIKHLMGRVYGVIWLSWHRFHWKWLLLKKKNDASLYRIKGNEI